MTRTEANIAYDTISAGTLKAWDTETIAHHMQALDAAKNMLATDRVPVKLRPIVAKQATQREAFILLAV